MIIKRYSIEIIGESIVTPLWDFDELKEAIEFALHEVEKEYAYEIVENDEHGNYSTICLVWNGKVYQAINKLSLYLPSLPKLPLIQSKTSQISI